MLKRFCLAVALTLATVSAVLADTYVKPHYRNGRYIGGHYRSSPNNTVRDNFSYYGNTNPYTGKVGTNRYYNSPSSEWYSPSRSYSYGDGYSYSYGGGYSGGSDAYGYGSYGSSGSYGTSTYGSTSQPRVYYSPKVGSYYRPRR